MGACGLRQPNRPKGQRPSRPATVAQKLAPSAIPDREAAAVGRLTGMAYTLTHKELRAKVTAITAESYSHAEQWLGAVTNKKALPLPARQLVPVLHALIEGLVLQRLLTPELVPDRVIRAAFSILAGVRLKRHSA